MRALSVAGLGSRGWWLLLLAAALLGGQAVAQLPSAGFSNFRHDRWMIYAGAPTGMREIQQTPDGWIWISGAEGLFRFDGFEFEKIPVPAGSPLERASAGPLLVTRSGELWVGYNQNAGVAVYRNGALHPVPMPKPPTIISDLAQTADGAIWASSTMFNIDANRLFRFANGRWEDADARYGLAVGGQSALCPTADGTLWLSLYNRDKTVLTYLRPGARRFEISEHRLADGGCLKDRNGRVWFAGVSGPLLLGPDGKPLSWPAGLARPVSVGTVPGDVDSSGGLWGSKSEAISHLASPAAAGRPISGEPALFAISDGLSSGVTYDFFVDRDDNVWVATELGLDRFRRASAVPEPAVEGDWPQGIGISQNGTELFIDTSAGFYQVSPGSPRKLLAEGPAGQCRAWGRGAWVLLPTRIVRLEDGRQRAIALPPGVEITSACAEDRHGRLWVGTTTGQLVWHDAQGWHVPKQPLPPVHWWDLTVTAEGDLAYTTKTGLVRVIGNKAHILPLESHDPGLITNLSVEGGDIYVSGSNGLLRIRGSKVARLDWRRFPFVARLRDLLQTPNGETWMMRAFFTSRVSTAALNRAFDDPNAPLDRIVLDLRDGLKPPQSNDYAGPQMAVGTDGRVWQLNREGVAVIDPSRLSDNAQPPPVKIRALTAAGTEHRDPAKLTLPAGSHAFDIAYTALSYTHPERVRFRYRLDGVDEDWVDPADRRLASYANLQPGHYRFQVIASDNQRSWSNPGAVLEIEIRPTFLQSWPFKLLCAIGAIALLSLVFSVRLRTVADRIQMRMAERVAERERIARELHDTLLQGIQGLMLRFQAVTDRITDPATRRSLDDALDQADSVLIEGRERVRDLRGEQQSELAQSLQQRIGTVADDRARIDLATKGEPRPLHALVATEALRIAEEAIRNAQRHSGSETISVVLTYGVTQFALQVSDTGTGIPEEMLGSGKGTGHFGLIGMQERAYRIGGSLAIVTGRQPGTQIVLTLPARTAYAERRVGYWARIRAAFGGGLSR
ncbi:triple tyrosine motif-containing protein [Sphingomonas sp. AOB5]|uniref:sensor histidine kinase n=1 Tax=Sphingomonas sp. AOB5 TaxID=3034017 RepID=UPI0023F9DC01|nr:sensor histidine kinase [Sphingomonas sp. AOB5]MDF7774063.1 triple tyrosine motif-containing protein [Sphingomonas sp. AOB5]